MANEPPVSLTHGPPETILPPSPGDAQADLSAALSESSPPDPAALAAIVARHPTFLDGWAALSEAALARGDVEGRVTAYACARVGYHRGLDTLRGAGWKGSGYVRWRHETNRGFLRSLEALRAAAEAIGEEPEAVRCAVFLHQLDPDWERETSGGLRAG